MNHDLRILEDPYKTYNEQSSVENDILKFNI